MPEGTGPVVAGTDFSEPAALAWMEARDLAERLGVAAELVHVVEGTATAGWTRGGAADRWLEAAGVSPKELQVRFGSAWVELSRYAADRDARFVVLGSHGSSGYQPLSIGSTASRVSVKSRSPVVLVSPQSGNGVPAVAGRHENPMEVRTR